MWRAIRLSSSVAGVVLVTWIASSVVPVNATTAAFAYLLVVLFIATAWGFIEALAASIAAALTFNFFFLLPAGRFTIADPQNWVGLFSFLATAVVASRLSIEAKRRASDAIVRQQDLERLYTLGRAILLIDQADGFPRQLVRQIADIFDLTSVVLYERSTEEFYRAGPADFDGLDDQLREAALQGTFFADPRRDRTITAIRLGSKPIAAVALQGRSMPDSVCQSIANLAAIALERAKAQDLAAQIDAARQSEKLRTTLLDALAHEFKTPLTSVIAVTTALLNTPDQRADTRQELLQIADEEAHRLKELIDETVEMGRLDSPEIRLDAEPSDIIAIVQDVVASMRTHFDDRPVEVICEGDPPEIAVDRRLFRLAVKQLLDNALKYSPARRPVIVRVNNGGDSITVAVTDHGTGIPSQEQSRIFERLYRSPSVERQIPGSGLGLSIALNIVRAHRGDLSVSSGPGETTFRLSLPALPVGAAR
jgi:two-component system sensor histidine kinase KdpD